jgi:FkbM family methyltransferase
MLYNIHDVYIGRCLDLYGEYSEGEVEIFRQIVRPSDMVIEGGANIGAHTIALSKMAGASGGICAFEPQRLVFQTLCANAALNSLTNIYCYQAALADKPGSLVIPITDPHVEQNFGNLEIRGHARGEQTAVLTIDSLPLRSCRLIKLDVEGMELQALLGASEVIKKFSPILYVENDRTDRQTELIRHIDSLGYAMFWHEPPLFNPHNYFKNAHNAFGSITSTNMLCVPGGMSQSINGLRKVAVPPAPA